MRKKTIKSYFFKKSLKNPSTSTLFCFSKRSIKQKKIIIDGGNVQKYKNRRDFFNDSAKNEKKYKFYVTHLIKYNQ